MEENNETPPDYLKGFNEGYLIARHMPELAEQLSRTKGDTHRLTGLQDGRKQFISEQVKDKLPDWLKSDRKMKDAPLPDKNKDRGIDKI